MQTLIDLVTTHGALLVFLITLAARIGAPLPAAPMLVVAGGLAAAGLVSLPLAFAVAVLANVVGDGLWFWAGRRHGHRVLGVLCRWSLSPDGCVRQSESLIAGWGASALVAAKFVPGVSLVAAPMAGAMGMSLGRFVASDALGGAVWSGLLLGLGWAFAGEVERILQSMAEAGTTATLVLLGLLAGFVAWRWWRRRRFLREAAVPRIAADELQALIDAAAAGKPAPLILDMRSAAAAALDPRHIPGALIAELDGIEAQAPRLAHDREIVTYCSCPSEASAAVAALRLRAAGLPRVRPLAGGLDGWAAAGRPVATTRPQALDGALVA